MFPEVSTPAVLIDLDIVDTNISRFQSYCDQHNLKLRPHIKTHKLPRFAKQQLAAGAIGITCQKISEAEAIISEGGIDDILITYNILGGDKVANLQKLSQKVCLSVVADNYAVIDGLSAGFSGSKEPLSVLVECDTGAGRCGVQTPEAAATLAAYIEATSHLRFSGLMTYPPAGGAKQIEKWLSSAIALIEGQGQSVDIVSSGGSPDMWQAHEMPLATEYRIGTYVYNDRSLVERGTCAVEDCAMTILATVVSTPTEHRAVIDAGSKVLTSDLLGLDGYGYIVGHHDLRIDQLSEEHGRIVGAKPHGLDVGQRIQIIPNHTCVVTNMLDELTLTRDYKFIETTPVTARGKVL